jgi:hypothetical protein
MRSPCRGVSPQMIGQAEAGAPAVQGYDREPQSTGQARRRDLNQSTRQEEKPGGTWPEPKPERKRDIQNKNPSLRRFDKPPTGK